MTSPSVLDPAGPVARALAGSAWLLIVGAAVVFGIVMVLLVWAVLRSPANAAPPGLEASERLSDRLSHRLCDRHPAINRRLLRRWLFVGGLLFPGVVLAALLVHTLWQAETLQLPRTPGEDVVGVTGRLWWWEVHYRDPATGTDFTLANELHLPQGRPVTLGLSSADVIHSFWVPALAGKVDMVPGRVHQLRLQADVPGVFRGQCAEFCGEQHARMALHVRVRPAAEHAAWLAAQAAPAQPPVDALAQRGLQVYAALTCSACHDLRGLAPGTRIGPDLTHVGSRLHLGAGSLRNGHDGLRRWLVDNQQVKPGVRMPSYAQLDASSMAALVQFLAGLQ